jgi:hypothetical protein
MRVQARAQGKGGRNSIMELTSSLLHSSFQMLFPSPTSIIGSLKVTSIRNVELTCSPRYLGTVGQASVERPAPSGLSQMTACPEL